METLRELLLAKLNDITQMLFEIDEIMPLNEEQGQYKYNIMGQLSAARTSLRETIDSMEWFIRKG